MGKIICEVCGTSYGETVSQCPICGTARPGSSATTGHGGSEDSGRGTYQHVKGGRFSKSNVRKRNKAMQDGAQSGAGSDYASRASKSSKKKDKNTGLVITAIVLVLAILAVIAYIAFHFLGSWLFPEGKKPGGQKNPAASITETVPVPCEEIQLGASVIELAQTDAAAPSEMIQYTLLPVDTTETVTFYSEDPTIADVTDKGKVMFVSPGQTNIIISCGQIQVSCKVRCTAEETTAPAETTEATVPQTTTEFALEPNVLFLYFIGDEGKIGTGEIDPVLITWKSADNEIASVEKGVVTQTGVGTVEIQATYAGQTAICTVFCTDDLGTGTGGGITEEGSSGGNTEEGTPGGTTTETGTTFRLYNPMNPRVTPEDIVIHKSQPLDLDLVDENGKSVSGVEWSVSDEAVCTVDERGVVKGVKVDTGDWAIVTAKYNGKEYKCKIRVWYA